MRAAALAILGAAAVALCLVVLAAVWVADQSARAFWDLWD